MIAYDLECGNGHRFEGWFEDVTAFDRQTREGLIACPFCDDTAVQRIPSTFAIKGGPGSAPGGDGAADLAALGQRIVDYVENHFENVGPDFAREALKMHYGVTQPRGIRGSSTPQEEATLKAEGIPFFKFPSPAKPSDADPT